MLEAEFNSPRLLHFAQLSFCSKRVSFNSYSASLAALWSYLAKSLIQSRQNTGLVEKSEKLEKRLYDQRCRVGQCRIKTNQLAGQRLQLPNPSRPSRTTVNSPVSLLNPLAGLLRIPEITKKPPKDIAGVMR